jgi:DNA-nicking Smr family endonuclease
MNYEDMWWSAPTPNEEDMYLWNAAEEFRKKRDASPAVSSSAPSSDSDGQSNKSNNTDSSESDSDAPSAKSADAAAAVLPATAKPPAVEAPVKVHIGSGYIVWDERLDVFKAVCEEHDKCFRVRAAHKGKLPGRPLCR